MNQNEYIRLSLELHLFFDRIMKEHSLFLEAAFTDKDKDLKRVANNFQRTFSDILERVITLSDGNVSRDLLESNEIVTRNTLEAENVTSGLSGIKINTNITLKEANLNSGIGGRINRQLLYEVSSINRQTLPIIQNLINFKNDILNKVLSCKMYTTNYPTLIAHIMREARMYYTLLSKVENRQPFTNEYIYEQELFWNTIMKEHAEFIRGLLDPSEEALILDADKFVREYKTIINDYSNNPVYLTNVSLKETTNFRNFKVAGEEGILNCKVKSIILPLLADHVVREANHFLRILRGSNVK